MSDILKAATKKLNPYDSALEDNLSMYDKLPYQRDANLCNRDSLGLVSGNILKNYRCKMNEPYEVKNMDDIITYKIAEVFQNNPDMNEIADDEKDVMVEDNLVEALTTDQEFPLNYEEFANYTEDDEYEE